MKIKSKRKKQDIRKRFTDEFGNPVNQTMAEKLASVREESFKENQTMANLIQEIWKISEDFLPKIFQCNQSTKGWTYQLNVQHKKVSKDLELTYKQRPSLKKLAKDIASKFGI